MAKCPHDDVTISEEAITLVHHGFTDGKWYGESGDSPGDLTGRYLIHCHRCKYERSATRNRAPKWARAMIDQIWDKKAVDDLPRRFEASEAA